MRILVASSLYPNKAGNGAQLQIWHVIRELRKYHEVHTVCVGAPPAHAGPEAGRPGDDDGGPDAMTIVPPVRLARHERMGAIVAGVVGGDPPQVIQLRRAGFEAAVARAVRRFAPDCVYVTTATAARVARVCGGVPAVLNAIDAWSFNEHEVYGTADPARRMLGRMLVSGIRRFEAETMRDYHCTVVVSAADRDWLRGIAPAARLRVISNGVDADYFHPADPAVALSAQDGGSAGVANRREAAPTLAFHGTMDYAPNIHGAQFLVASVLPLLWRRRPEVRVVLLGRSPAPQVRALAGPQVEVTGALDDIRPTLWSADVSILPLLTGSGVKNKLLEAAAMAKPIVATPSALGDLQLADGVHARIAGDAQSLADAVLSLLDDPQAASRLGRAARQFVLERHTWESVGREISAVCAEAVRDTPGR